VGALEPHFWRTLCERLDLTDLADKQFAEGEERETIFRRVRDKFRERTMAEWMALLADQDICFGPVASVSEMLADPQVRHRRMVLELDGRLTLGNPLKLSATPPELRTAAPRHGEHADAELARLGYAPAEVAGLRERGVV
jgi:formyl-CoA transferase/CoA:oxalate CoA-transferase